MPFVNTILSGVIIFEPVVYEDNRGYFFESFNEKTFAEAGIHMHWVQDNQASSSYGVIRGLHYQLHPFAQAKLVRVLSGSIWDVALDIRQGSPTYGRSFGCELSAENKRQLLIPHGFAHGYSVLSEKAEVLYKCDALYNKESEGGIIYNDPHLNIDWKIPLERVIISSKDQNLPLLAECRNNFTLIES